MARQYLHVILQNARAILQAQSRNRFSFSVSFFKCSRGMNSVQGVWVGDEQQEQLLPGSAIVTKEGGGGVVSNGLGVCQARSAKWLVWQPCRFFQGKVATRRCWQP